MNIIKYWNSYYKYSGFKLIIIVIISPFVGILDAVGIALFFSVIQSQFYKSDNFENPIYDIIYDILSYVSIDPAFEIILHLLF